MLIVYLSKDIAYNDNLLRQILLFYIGTSEMLNIINNKYLIRYQFNSTSTFGVTHAG